MTPRYRLFLCLALSGLGLLGQDPFQQSVSYRIEVALNDVDHYLDGFIRMDYGNNSPVALDTVWVHLWPNGYKDRFSGLCNQKVGHNDFDLYFASPEDKGMIDSLDFKIDGKKARWGYHERYEDIAWILPNENLSPGASISITTPFRVKIPSGKLSRLGHIGQSYQITQWYPKFAVFDDQGWHTMPYLNQGEFFSEFGNFNVFITLPKNYVVGATGELQNANELAWLNKLAAQPIDPNADNNFPSSSKEMKTLHFHQDRVHDFAWFADMRYIVRKGSVILPKSNKEVTTWTMFTPRNAKVWEKGIEFLNEATLGYSHWVGDYPYSQITGVDGTISAGGGMEYPMITVIGQTSNAYELDIVLSHEAGHNWFYGILASNERDHPWLDEGLNSFVEMQHIGDRYEKLGLVDGIAELALGTGSHEETQGYRYQSEITYLFQARRGKDQPLNLHSEAFTSFNYGAMVYAKTALVFDMLLAYLGEERFVQCMNTYYDTWAFNHPGPKDVRRVFEQVSREDLAWCFDGLVGTDKKYDPKALSINGQTFSYAVKGGILAPFPVSAWKGDELLGTEWVQPSGAQGTVTLPWEGIELIRIDAEQTTLDIDRTNNQVRSTGVFKRALPVKFKFLGGAERSDKEFLFWNLLGSYNTADGFALGPALYNTAIPAKRTEFVAAPMYAFQSENLVGGFRLAHHFDRSTNWMRGLSFGLTGRRSGVVHTDDAELNYTKFVLSARQEFAPNQVNKPTSVSLSYRGIWIEEQFQVNSIENNTDLSVQNTFHELTLTASRAKGINPFSLSFNVLSEPQTFLRADIEAKWHIILNKKEDRLSFRLFAGQFFFTDLVDPRAAYNSSGQVGSDDLLYDGLFVGRSERQGVWNQQFLNTQGGLKTPTARGGSDDYILGFNVELDFPTAIPLVAFAGTAIAPSSSFNDNGELVTEAKALYETGVGLRLIRDVFDVWMPLAFSSEIAGGFDFQGIPFHERIRFTLNLQRLDPTRLLRKAAP